MVNCIYSIKRTVFGNRGLTKGRETITTAKPYLVTFLLHMTNIANKKNKRD